VKLKSGSGAGRGGKRRGAGPLGKPWEHSRVWEASGVAGSGRGPAAVTPAQAAAVSGSQALPHKVCVRPVRMMLFWFGLDKCQVPPRSITPPPQPDRGEEI